MEFWATLLTGAPSVAFDVFIFFFFFQVAQKFKSVFYM